MQVRQVYVDSRTMWVDTGIDVEAGEYLSIEATGQVKPWDIKPLTGPEGYNEHTATSIYPSARFCSLVGRINSSEYLGIGEEFGSYQIQESGRLELSVNDLVPGEPDDDFFFQDNTGWFIANIIVSAVPLTTKPANHKGKPDCPICYSTFGGESGQTPVSLIDGEKRETVTDLTIQTPGEPLTFFRTYNQNRQDMLKFMGLGWTHNHAITLDTSISGKRIVRMPSGGEARFTQDTLNPNIYAGDPGSSSSIVFDSGTSQHTLTASDKSEYVFDSQGRLVTRRWPNNETWTYDYFTADHGDGSAEGLLKEVADDYGNKLRFAYRTTFEGGFDDSNNPQLWRVGDHTVPAFGEANDLEWSSPDGRYVEFDYSENVIEDSGSPGTVISGDDPLLIAVHTARQDEWGDPYEWNYAYHDDAQHLDVLNYLKSITSPELDDGSRIIVKDLDYSYTRDLAVNGDMEADTGWEAISTANLVHTDGNAYSGNYAWLVTANQDDGIQGLPWNLLDGRGYTITAYVFIVSGSVKMQVEGTSAFDRYLSTSGSWIELTAAVVPSLTLPDVRLQFVGLYGAAQFYVDSVTIEEKSNQLSTITQRLGKLDTGIDFLKQTDYIFQPGGENVTHEIADGRLKTYYFAGGVYAGAGDASDNNAFQGLNDQYRLSQSVDPNGNNTTLDWSADGNVLNSVTDAANNSTSFTYDIEERLITSIDAQGHKTEYTYGDATNPRQPTVIKVFEFDGGPLLRQQEYTYNSKGQITDEKHIDTDGTTILRQTTRSYYSSGNGNGRLETLTENAHLPVAERRTTTYIYDNLGRVIRTNRNSLFGTCQYNYTIYDEADNVLGTACSRHSASTNPTNTQDLRDIYNADPDSTTVTLHEYDAVGRRVKTVSQAESPLEQIALTFFDALDRVRLQISNYVTSGYDEPGEWSWLEVNDVWGWYTSSGEYASLVDQGTNHSQNIITQTTYNARGLVESQRNSTGVASYTVYDDAERPVRVIINYVEQNGTDPADWIWDETDSRWEDGSGNPIDHGTDNDQNLITETIYDPNGNAVKTIGMDRQVTLTGYDALNRVVKTVRAASDPDYNIDVDRPLANYPQPFDLSDEVDEDRITETSYDQMGRVVTQTDETGVVTRFVYDGLGRQTRVIRNYVAQGTTDPKDWEWANNQWEDGQTTPTAIDHGTGNDQNLITEAVYDAEGRTLETIATQDGKQIRTRTIYDAEGRSVGTVRNYVEQGSSDPADWQWVVANNRWEDGAGNPIVHGSNNDQNIIEKRQYNSDGRVEWTVDAVGRYTLNHYDAAGRLIKVIGNASDPDATDLENYVPSTDPDQDMITENTYDVIGRVVKTRRLLENRGGTEVWTTTLTGFDTLGRQVKTISNASQPDYDFVNDPDLSEYVPSADPALDMITETIYDADGRVLYTLDPSEVPTWTAYDALGRSRKTITNPVGTAQDGSSNDPRSATYFPSVDGDTDIINATDYSSDGRVKKTIDPLDRETVNVYDRLGRVIRTVRNYVDNSYADPSEWVRENGMWKDGPGGTAINRGSHDDLNIVTDTVYDMDGRVGQRMDNLGNTTYMVYDAVGRQVMTIRNYAEQNGTNPANWVWTGTQWEDGNSVAIDHGTDNAQNMVSTTTYDLAGRVVSTRDAAGLETRHSYDDLGRRIQTITNYVNGTFDPLNPDEDRSTTTVYDIGGRVMQSTDPRGTITGFNYDHAGRRVSVTQDMGGSLETSSYTCYDKAGRVRRTIAAYMPIPADATIPAGAQDDSDNILPDAQDENGDWYFAPSATETPADQNIITEMIYDQAGRRVQTISPMGDAEITDYYKDGKVEAMTDPEGTMTKYRYDGLRRRDLVVQGYEELVSAVDPDTWKWNNRWEEN